MAGLLGIALSIAAAVKMFTPGEEKSIKKKEAKLRLNNLEPKLESSYVLMAQDTYFFSESDSAEKTGRLYFLNYPLLKNEIAFENGEGQLQLAETFDDTGMVRVTYLVLQNNGQSAPQDLQVVMKRYVLKDKVTIEETPGSPGTSYEAAVRAKAADSSVRTFNPPTVLETGKGIRVPLFLESEYDNAVRTGNHKWSVVSKIVYLPDKLIYTDPFDGAKKEVKIRSMKDPVKIATGIEGRG